MARFRWSKRGRFVTAAFALILVLWVFALVFHLRFQGRVYGGAIGQGGLWLCHKVPTRPVSIELSPGREWWFVGGSAGSTWPGAWVYYSPLWPLVLVLGVAAAWNRPHRVPGVCRRCGYDLTGLARCPECGTPARPSTV
jgi:hypothetical protein